MNDDNTPINVEIDRVLHIPDLPTRLLSPQQLVQQTGGIHDGLHIGARNAVLTFGGHRRTINYHPSNKLPIFTSFPGVEQFRAFNALITSDGSATDSLTFNQRQLLHWHRRLSHMNYQTIQKFSRLNLLPKELSKVRPEEYPICPCCQFGKQKRKPVQRPTEESPSIGSLAERPGDVVSVDMIHSPVGGLIPVSKGKTLQEKYHIACVFVDQSSKFVFVTYQMSTSAAETVDSKHRFEQYAASHGVTIKHYCADNGAFNTRLFKESVLAARQTIDFCGVNAHHQNGVVERMIQTLTYRARSLLLHAMFHWAEVVTAEFWPFPLRLIVDTHNNSPLPNGLCPIELFANVKRRTNLRHYHTFGCPAYVLDNRLSSGGSVPKWNPRARRGIYLGLSPEHASNVALKYNPHTGYVSTQYHVVYDDDFTSVERKSSVEMQSVWEQLFATSRDVPPDDYLLSPDPPWDPTTSSASRECSVLKSTTKDSHPTAPSVPEGASPPPVGATHPSEGDVPSEGVVGFSEVALSPHRNDASYPTARSSPAPR